MSGAAWALQKSIVSQLSLAPELQNLSAHGSHVPVYDAIPRQTTLPYIALGQMSSFDWSTGTEEGQEHLLNIHVWSQYEGKKEIQLISEVVERVLSDESLSVVDYHLVNFVHLYTDVRFVESQKAYRSILRFRVVTESVH